MRNTSYPILFCLLDPLSGRAAALGESEVERRPEDAADGGARIVIEPIHWEWGGHR